MADRLIDQIPFHHRLTRNHWLCEQLNDTAEILDPETYRKLVTRTTRKGLIELGMPEYMANVIGAGAGFDIKVVLGKTPIGHISKVLRVLIPLACPDISKCPARKKVFNTLYESPTYRHPETDRRRGPVGTRGALDQSLMC